MERQGFINFSNDSKDSEAIAQLELLKSRYISDEELETFITNLPKHIEYITFSIKNDNMRMTGKLNNLDIPIINKIIEMLKKQGRKIKILGYIGDGAGNMSNKDFDYSFFYKISDPSYVDSYSPLSRDKAGFIKCINGQIIKSRLDVLKISIKNVIDSNLSPFEKLICCYNITKSFKKYNDSPKGTLDNLPPRSLYQVLVNEYMVCVGYSQMLRFLLNECGIDCVVYDDNEHTHELVYATINDDKYGIHGYYKLDPTNDIRLDDKMMISGYSSFCKDPTKSQEKTNLDLFLSDEYVSKYNFSDDLSIIIDLLEPSFKTLSVEGKAKKFKEIFDNQKYKEIPENLLLQAIVYIEQHIFERKKNDQAKNKRMLEIYDELFFDGKILVSDYSLYDKRKGYAEKVEGDYAQQPKKINRQASTYLINLENEKCSCMLLDENGKPLENITDIKWKHLFFTGGAWHDERTRAQRA